ncbi:cAMP-dependent protein kinase type II-beta regulatory subunit [Homalodisca vitripennis]|nr:cAMP-dependent protein kinase type II-beta regulatory subunit [Homalodisca vitripennis]
MPPPLFVFCLPGFAIIFLIQVLICEAYHFHVTISHKKKKTGNPDKDKNQGGKSERGPRGNKDRRRLSKDHQSKGDQEEKGSKDNKEQGRPNKDHQSKGGQEEKNSRDTKNFDNDNPTPEDEAKLQPANGKTMRSTQDNGNAEKSPEKPKNRPHVDFDVPEHNMGDENKDQSPKEDRQKGRRKSVFAESYDPSKDDEDLGKVVHPKTPEEKEWLIENVRNITLFEHLANVYDFQDFVKCVEKANLGKVDIKELGESRAAAALLLECGFKILCLTTIDHEAELQLVDVVALLLECGFKILCLTTIDHEAELQLVDVVALLLECGFKILCLTTIDHEAELQLVDVVALLLECGFKILCLTTIDHEAELQLVDVVALLLECGFKILCLTTIDHEAELQLVDVVALLLEAAAALLLECEFKILCLTTIDHEAELQLVDVVALLLECGFKILCLTTIDHEAELQLVDVVALLLECGFKILCLTTIDHEAELQLVDVVALLLECGFKILCLTTIDHEAELQLVDVVALTAKLQLVDVVALLLEFGFKILCLTTIDHEAELQLVDVDQTTTVVDAMYKRPVSEGDFVMKQGDKGSTFYIVQTGIFDVYVKDAENVESLIHTYDNKGSFGELALLYNQPRAATIVARTDGLLWAVDGHTFRRIVHKITYQKRIMYESLINNVPMLKTLEPYERANLVDALIPMTFKHNDEIIKQGTEGDGMYFIISGGVRIMMRTINNRDILLKELSNSEYFGELALVTDKPRAASAFAIGDTHLAFLDREAFERLLGPCMDVIKRHIDNYNEQLLEIERAQEQ